MGGLGRRGFYEIIMAFFLITVLIFAVIFFLFMNTSSSLLYGKLKQASAGPRDAQVVKDALLTCHNVDYLKESVLDAQVAGTTSCAAQEMLGGFRVERLALNGCAAKEWSLARGDHAQAVPFIIAIEDPGGRRCIGRLEILLGEA